MTHKEILYKLIGPINPYGASHIDEERFKNLQTLCVLIDELLYDIRDVAVNKERQEHSMKIMGQFADTYLKSLNQ